LGFSSLSKLSKEFVGAFAFRLRGRPCSRLCFGKMFFERAQSGTKNR
jgi:hypothetical protein